jgi:hypothetical protein
VRLIEVDGGGFCGIGVVVGVNYVSAAGVGRRGGSATNADSF